MSSRIENYLGFPAGLSGEELAARAALQAQKFGVCIMLASKAVSLSSENDVHHVTFESGEVISAKSVIIATGARYNRLPLDRLAEFEGVGVYYAATQMEAMACGDGPVVIVGGGNSAGQAALFLAATCAQVYIAIRGRVARGLHVALPDRPDRAPAPHQVLPHTQVTALVGESLPRKRGARPTAPAGGVDRWPSGACSSSSAPTGHRVAGGPAGRGRARLPPHRHRRPPPTARRRRDGHRSSSRPAGRGSSAWATSAPGRSSAAPTAIGEGSMAVRLVFERLQATGSAAADPARV